MLERGKALKRSRLKGLFSDQQWKSTVVETQLQLQKLPHGRLIFSSPFEVLGPMVSAELIISLLERALLGLLLRELIVFRWGAGDVRVVTFLITVTK